MEDKIINPAHRLAKKLQENKKSLHIARVPDKTKADFIALAEADFCSDWGMCMKDIFEKAQEYTKLKSKLFLLINALEEKQDAS